MIFFLLEIFMYNWSCLY